MIASLLTIQKVDSQGSLGCIFLNESVSTLADALTAILDHFNQFFLHKEGALYNRILNQ